MSDPAAAGTVEPVLVGDRVRLRPARDDDAPHFVRWANDPEFSWMQWGRGPGRFLDEAAARGFIARFPPPDSGLFVIEHLGPRASGASATARPRGSGGRGPQGAKRPEDEWGTGSEQARPIGFANYRDLRPKPRSAEIGIGIGERALWSKGLGRDALRALLRHLTEDLGLHRVTLHVLSYNDRAIASYKACGFEVEGVLRDAVMTDRGHFADSVEMAYLTGREQPAFDPRPIVLEGTYIRLEPLRMEHAADLYAAVAEDDIWTWLSEPGPRSVADMEDYVRRALDLQTRGEHLPWVTRRVADGRVIGTTRYGAIDRTDRSVEIGWTMLATDARRTAANTEAKLLQLRHAFEDLGALRVSLKADVRNERSRRAIERIGAKLDGIIRNERVVRDGRVRDAAYYSFISKEWPAARRRLEALLVRP